MWYKHYNKRDEIGTFPYKRHSVNEGKNCLNGRNSIDIYKNKITEAIVSNSGSDLDKAIESIAQKLKSADADKVTVICSGNNTNEELDSINKFAASRNYNIAVYADNMANCEEVASYDEVESASKVFIIGDILYDNPLVGRRIVHAKKNGATIIANDSKTESVTFNISDECQNLTVSEFIDKIKDQLNDSSIIVFNQVDSYDDSALIMDAAKSANAKILPMYSKCNTKGALSIAESKSIDELKELLSKTDVLLVFNDDIINEIDFDFKTISEIISFTPSKNDTSEISDIVIPVKSWLECEGSFTNAMGDVQTFNPAVNVNEDSLSEIEIIEKLEGNL